jgi:hypothetical protein
MSLLADFLTEDELEAELRKKTHTGSKRTLRNWRTQRKGPPWVKTGNTVLYPSSGFLDWLTSQIQQPVRNRRAA